eukprot:CAMPEP_0198655216 /NCGR_PEP_ID=MMETSP1467-20131203/8221_1 /TAXON_ID=1462469 /ORGANISM="unid. sp., Strain CCMP2135" /LENGTH=74 /DNA_ID=CAMNT_0044391219 /DNA_START=71 /DNA_END=292 /DNA_ORIENTATION=+
MAAVCVSATCTQCSSSSSPRGEVHPSEALTVALLSWQLGFKEKGRCACREPWHRVKACLVLTLPSLSKTYGRSS